METAGLPFLPREDIRALIKAEYLRRKSANPRYSLRGYARVLGVSHSTLSEVLSGRRRISLKQIDRFAKALHWNERRTEDLKGGLSKDPLSYTRLSIEQIALLSSWLANVILELFLVQDFKADAEWIANRLGVEISQVEETLESLIRAGMLTQTGSGGLKLSTLKTSTLGQLQAKESIIHLQRQFLDLQSQALKNAPIEMQSSMGLTIAIDSDDLPRARELLYRCLKDLTRLFNRKGVKRNAVYRLQLGAFPVVHPKVPPPREDAIRDRSIRLKKCVNRPKKGEGK